MKIIACITLLLLVSCGSGTIKVTYIETDKQEIDSICNSGDCEACAQWNFKQGTCTIWMQPLDSYYSEQVYHEVLGHEMRHCIEGYWHD